MSITLPAPHDGVAGPLLTPEDWARSRDRGRVARARGGGRRWLLFWLLAGPGILAMLGENDGPSMVSYTATGAAYGMGFFLPFIVVTFAMAVICQEMCMRVGVTASFNNRPRAARLFYAASITTALIAAGIILIPGAPLLPIALNANVLATVLLPVTLVFVILLAGDRQLMGRQASTTWLNVAAAAIVTVVAGCGAAYGIDSFLPAAHLIPGG